MTQFRKREKFTAFANHSTFPDDIVCHYSILLLPQKNETPELAL